MSAVWLRARSDLRARWRSWLLLGLLTGVAFGVGAAGLAGARRADQAVPRGLAASPRLDAAVLPNDPAFDEVAQSRVAALPEVEEVYPFIVPFFLTLTDPEAEGPLVPTTPASSYAMESTLVAGRHTDPTSASEVVVDENFRDLYGVDIGSTITLSHSVPPGATDELPVGPLPQGVDFEFQAPLTIVGISKSFASSDVSIVPSAGFYREYGTRLIGPTNMFVTLRDGEEHFTEFQKGVQEVMGRSINVERGSDFLGIRQLRNLTVLERNALLLFAAASVAVGSVLVGQALVRTVASSREDGEGLRALGADRRLVVRALAAPTVPVSAVAALSTFVLAVGLSSRFPLGAARRIDLDVGTHIDWLVVGPAVLAAGAFVLATGALTARWHAGAGASSRVRTPSRWALAASRARWPSVLVGTRLVSDPPRGGGSVALRSTLVGLVVGVVGVLSCVTFRAGINDTLDTPERSGVEWDAWIAAIGGPVGEDAASALASSPFVDQLFDAMWLRSTDVNGTAVSVFGTRAVVGRPTFVMLDGRAPTAPDEIAVAPATRRLLGVSVGDRVTIGKDPNRTARVVGIALLPETSHTAYDQGAWIDSKALDTLLAAEPPEGPEDLVDYQLVKWVPGAEVAGQQLLEALGSPNTYSDIATLPPSVAELRTLRVLPAVLAVLFALLAVATVAHALVTTVRQRRRDLAVLRSLGFTRRQSRLAIAWQATLLAFLGLAIGVPLGIVAGRSAWRLLAHEYPITYVPPAGVVAVALVVPVTLLLANVVALGPAVSASRIRPSEALRVE